ncbi:MAG: serine--tRNA ligase [Nanoarchaeota archaeon]|nr:serine--tRNA ligase [Nanoarchaeota archaeon]
MLDIKLLRENAKVVKASQKKKEKPIGIVDDVLVLDNKWKKELQKVEQLKRLRNTVSQEINVLKKAGKSGKEKIKEMKKVAADIRKKEEKANKILEKRNEELEKIHNVMHKSVPKGKDDSDNIELKKKGKKPSFNFPIKNHVELCEKLGLADFDSSAKTSGNGFYFLKNGLALLNQALIRFAVDFMHGKEYEYIEPPLLINKDVLGAAINTEEFANTIYSIENEDLALIGTSEHALLGVHANEALPENDLPKRYFSYSMCFRKEIGAHGINEKGLWRTHQFNKVEQFVFCKPENSHKYFDELLKNSEELLAALGLPYRVIEICSGDLSAWKHRSYDVEVWRPTTQSYGEIMSLSNCTDYQARKLNIRLVRNSGQREIVHTLNNTAIATSRIMVAILENFQTKQGTVKIPKVLWPYMNGITELK